MTASLRLSGKVDLSLLLHDNEIWAKQNRGFDAVSLRLFTVSDSAVTALIYSSGSVVLVGGRSINQLKEAQTELMAKTGLQVAVPFVIHNIACSMTVSPLHLFRLAQALKMNPRYDDVSYEPELFPALSFKLKGTKRKACVFSSGKINLVGNKTIDEAKEMRHDVLSFLFINSFVSSTSAVSQVPPGPRGPKEAAN